MKKVLFFGIPLLLTVVVSVFELYVAAIMGVDIPGFSSLRALGNGPTQAEIATGKAVEQKIIQAMGGNAAFYVEITSDDLNKIIRGRMYRDAPIKTASVRVHPGGIAFSGALNGRAPVSISGETGIALNDQGVITLTVREASAMALPLLGTAKDQLAPALDQVIALNTLFAQAGATTIQRVVLHEGNVAVTGIQPKRSPVPVVAQAKSPEGPSAPVAPSRAAPIVPEGARSLTEGTVTAKHGNEVYLAIGDSLAAGVGVPRGTQGYVSRFHHYLELQTGKTLGLINTGIPGESTLSIRSSGQWQRALNEINSRKNDGDPATRVSVVTLDLGANDLLAHLASSTCRNAPTGVACKTHMDAAIAVFKTNFAELTGELKAAMEPGTEFYIMTFYDPFSLGIGLSIEQNADEVVGAMNSYIAQRAQEVGAKVADAAPLMHGNAGAWTLVLQGDVHPNAIGYQVLTYAFVTARTKG